tara:strand:- start:2887 stop:3708 length:822 start_codon:yes stop_codon:yes gene_type:complete
MAKPNSRLTLQDYVFRQLGAPILEINVADEQFDDLLDDSLQLFYERHFDGVEKVLLKYKLTTDDIRKGRARGGDNNLGITTTTTTSGDFEENENYLTVPDSVLGIEKVHQFNSSGLSNGMFNLKYQLFLNDIAFNMGYNGLLNYAQIKTYLEDINFLLTTSTQIRYNKRNNRLYLDIDWAAATDGHYILIECYRIMDPSNYSGVYNDYFLKKYLTAKTKKQWGQNLIKFQGVKLPGGVELNGRQLYEDADFEIREIEEKMQDTYEMPVLDMIG